MGRQAQPLQTRLTFLSLGFLALLATVLSPSQAQTISPQEKPVGSAIEAQSSPARTVQIQNQQIGQLEADQPEFKKPEISRPEISRLETIKPESQNPPKKRADDPVVQTDKPERTEPNFSDFLRQLRAGEIAKVDLNPNGQAQIIKQCTPKSAANCVDDERYSVQLLLEPGLYVALDEAARTKNLIYRVNTQASRGAYIAWGLQILSVLFIVGLFFFFRSRSNTGGGGGGFASEFSKSKAKAVQNPKTTFKDVAGCDEAKEELSEIVDFLKNPTRFHDIGARIPHGCLLVGPPGSGKTLLAKAVAGVGAARVRDLFEQAKKAAPCIIFIDEIDAVGRKRGSGLGGGNDEREQTLNQLLVEMDGFETKHDIIIIAATNRPDVLDPALLRPGRFDRQVTVDAPDIKGREEILRVHARKKPLEDNVDLRTVARRTPGFVGADLENLLNEAALLAARGARRKISYRDIDEAADRVVMGPERKSRVISDADKRITAYHEVGHALAANLLPMADRVHKLTIVPRGRAAGYMMPLPSDQMHYSKNKLLDRIGVALAGRAAEDLEFGDVTTGAQNDFQQATGIARKMVTEWGMSERLGLIAHSSKQESFLGAGMQSRDYSDDTAKAIDEEVKAIMEVQYERARTLLEQNREVMHTIVAVLLERETLTGEEFQCLLEGGELPELESEAERPEPPTEISENGLERPPPQIKLKPA
jgi:cell division protease FtsH